MLFQTFGSYLGCLIDARMTLAEFRAATGISETFLSNILADRVPMSLKRIDEFADLLVEGKDDRERFCLAAELTHVPLRLRKVVLIRYPDIMAVQTAIVSLASKRKRSKRRTTAKIAPKPGASS